MALDKRENSYVGLKVQKSANHYREAAFDEIDLLEVRCWNFWKLRELSNFSFRLLCHVQLMITATTSTFFRLFQRFKRSILIAKLM